jgi:hypothetical protein
MMTNHPETVEWLSWGLATLRSLGLAAIVVVWAGVSLMILAVPAILGLFLGRPQADSRQMGWNSRYPHAAGPGEMPSRPGDPAQRVERR